MKPVGIIANPASGKDIRRLIAAGTVVTNQEKINIIVRILKALDAQDVEDVVIMPDPTGIARRVVKQLGDELNTTRVTELDMPYIMGTQKDSLRAARLMNERQFSCIIVMGGDGTCRIVAKGCGKTPILPVSTGTNNVFPQMIEGTLIGMAAAAIATGTVSETEGVEQMPQLELHDANRCIDIALVDLAVLEGNDTAARAVWDASVIKELFLSRARSNQIGLSSIGGCFAPQPKDSVSGLHIKFASPGEPGNQVLAPIAPGLFSELTVMSHHSIGLQPRIISYKPSVIALDGEREIVDTGDTSLYVRFNRMGPRVINVDRTLEIAAIKGFWLRPRVWNPVQSLVQQPQIIQQEQLNQEHV